MEKPKGPSWFYLYVQLPLSRVVAWMLFTLLGPFRVRGRRRIPRTGGLLILANHLSDCDPVVIQLACPRPIVFMAKSELFEMPVVGSLVRAYRGFPVKRGEPDRNALRLAAEYAKAGEVVCVFPEGELSQSGELQELKPGVALIAKLAGCPVICARLENTNKIIPYGSMVPRPAFAWVSASWGEPSDFGSKPDVGEVMEWARGELSRGV